MAVIYKDKWAVGDKEKWPHERPGPCLNCGRHWLDHYNWACDKNTPRPAGNFAQFDQIDPNRRYLTASMRDSIATTTAITIVRVSGKVNAPAVAAVTDDRVYAFFAAPRPGNCACDIPRKDCEYHR